MKLTNKLLLGLAIGLFVLPVGGMALWTKANSQDSAVYYKSLEDEVAQFTSPDQYFVSKKMKAFDKISIQGSPSVFLTLYLVKSDDFGFKVSKGYESLFTSEVDTDGALVLNATDKERFSSPSLYIYAPKFDELFLTSIGINAIRTDLDSLKITFNAMGDLLYFGENKNLKYLDLILKSSSVSMNGISGEDCFPQLENVTLNLLNSSFVLDMRKYENITANLDNSSLSYAKEDGDHRLFISELNVNARGNSSVGFFEAPQVGKLYGTFSDSTTVLMPIGLYKNILKK